jgi:hypothetical protein
VRRSGLPRGSGRRPLLLGLGIAALVSSGGCGASGTLGAKALSQHASSLRSVAAEGALLAEDAGDGKTTRIFTREHSSELDRVAGHISSTLASARPARAVEPNARRLTAVAVQISAALKRLGGASRAEQRALARALEAEARRCEQIGRGLA